MPGVRLVVSNYTTTAFQVETDHEIRYDRPDGHAPVDLRPDICKILRDAADAIEKAAALRVGGDINSLKDRKGLIVGDWSIELLSSDAD